MHHPPSSTAPAQPGRLRGLGSLLFVLTAVLLLPAGPEAGPYRALATIFGSIVLEALPFMLLGALVGGLIEAFVSRERMTALLPRHPLATLCTAAALGLIFPVCECAVVPVVRRLLGKGLPFSAAIAYLLAGPVVNPIVAASTALAYGFDWRVTAARLGMAYLIAIAVAWIMGRLFPDRTALRPGLDNIPLAPCSCGCADGPLLRPFSEITDAVRRPTLLHRLEQAARHGAADFLGTAHYLIIGAFIAALAQTFVNRSLLLDFTSAPFVAVPLMSGLAVALNLCSEADAFIAASFRGLVPISAQLAFMLTGPMFDLKLLLMYQTIFRKQPIAVLGALVLICTMLGAVCVTGGMP